MTPPTQPVIPYASQVDPNRDSTIALIFGICGVVPLFLPGILAIRYGRTANIRSNATGTGKHKAKAAIVLGCLNLLASLVFFAILPSAYIHARQKSEAIQCAVTLRMIGQSCTLYASSNAGWLPPNLSYVSVPVNCPVASTPYVYLLASTNLNSIPSPNTTALAYEPLSNHGGRGINVLFADGHVEWMMPSTAIPFLARMTPTTSPTATH